MITSHIVTITCNSPYYPWEKDLGSRLTELTKLGRIVSVFPFGNPQPPTTHNQYCVAIEQEDPVVIEPTADNDLAARLEELSKMAEVGPWYAGRQVGEEEHQYISIGGHDVSDRAGGHHYEDTILEVWDNGNLTGEAKSTANLLCELVNNLPTIIKALRN